MARSVETKGSRTAQSIQRAGLRLIADYGYEAVSLRQLATQVGLQPASLYNHIESKQALLFGLIQDHLTALTEHCDLALAAVPPDPAQQLRAFISQHVLYHLGRKQEVLVANLELRSLEPENYAKIIRMRRAYEGRLIRLLELGVDAGRFGLRDVRVSAYAILAMLTGACVWFKPSGRLTKAEMVALHVDMVFGGCVVPGAAGGGNRVELVDLGAKVSAR